MSLRRLTMLGPYMLGACLVAIPAFAQQSPGFRLEESTFNAGGSPRNGSTSFSASFTISLEAVADSVAAHTLNGPTYGVDGGFVHLNAPAGEVSGLGFASEIDLTWNAGRSVSTFNLYRAALSGIADLTYGACLEHGLVTPSAIDGGSPPPSDGFFYLATAVNRLTEESSKGFDSAGAQRPNAVPCP